MSHFTKLMMTTNEFEVVPEDLRVSDEYDSEDNSKDDFEYDSINDFENNSESDEDSSNVDSENDISPTSMFSSFSRCSWTVYFRPPPIHNNFGGQESVLMCYRHLLFKCLDDSLVMMLSI